MSSRIYKAQELINGKSKFLTKEGIEEKKKEYYLNVVKKLPDIIAKINKKKMKYDHDHFSIFYNGKYKLKILVSASAKGSGLVTAITVYHIQYKTKLSKPVLELKGSQITELKIKTKIEKAIKPEIKRIKKERERKNKTHADIFFKDFERSIKNRSSRYSTLSNILQKEKKRNERKTFYRGYHWGTKKDLEIDEFEV